MIGSGADSINQAMAQDCMAENDRLREQATWLNLALDASGAGVSSWDIASGSLRWDHRMRRLYGFGTEEAITLDALLARIHPEDRTRLVHDIGRIWDPANGDIWNHELRIAHPQLGERWIGRTGKLERDSKGRPVRALGVSFDITERKQAEQTMLEWNQELERRVEERTAQLQQSEVRFRQLAEAAFEGIGVTENGILFDCNEQLARLHGCHVEKLIGLPLIDLISPEWRDEVRLRLTGESAAFFETVCLKCDGTTFPAEIRLSSRSWDERKILVAAVRDVSTIKEAAARVQSLQMELQAAQRLSLVSEISAGIVHQIGQPLTSMGLNVSVAINRLRAGSFHQTAVLEVLLDIERDIRMVRETISHLRSLAHPEQPTVSYVDLNKMIMDCVGLVAREAARRQVRIETDLDRQLPEINGDAVQLSQVLLVLLNNALDAVVSLTADRRVVRVVTAAVAPDSVLMRVMDFGEGIPEKIRPHLFSPFLSSKPDGAGIGLRLSRTIVQSHGGSIHGRNRVDGKGAEFEVTLPARQSTQACDRCVQAS